MKPYNERTPDYQYQNLLKQILENGTDVNPIQGEGAKMIFGAQFRFDMNNGFPMITERDLSGKMMLGALGEHIGFLHGARTHEKLSEYDCPWWSKWVTKEKCEVFGLPEGDLGPGSYGAAWTNFPTAEGTPFNQIKEVVRQIKERPHLRTHVITPWIPQYTIQHSDLQRKVVVAPCHGWLHVLVFPETKEISLHHTQRSGDLPVGVVFNMIQYAAFLMMLGQVTGYKPKEYIHTFSDVHMYAGQIEKVRELISREPYPFPTMTLDPTVTDIFDFRPNHFTLTDYKAHPKMLIPTPV